MHCCCSKFRKIQFQCRLRSSVSLTRRQCTWHVPRSLSLLSGASHACVEPSWRRWHAGPPSPASSAASGPPVAADRGQERRLNAVPRRPSPLCSPRGLMRASARPWHRHRGRQARDALPAADGPAPPRSVELTPKAPNSSSISTKTEPWTSTMTPNVLITPTKPCAAVIVTGDPRSRPPPRTADIRPPRRTRGPAAPRCRGPRRRGAGTLGSRRRGDAERLRRAASVGEVGAGRPFQIQERGGGRGREEEVEEDGGVPVTGSGMSMQRWRR